MLSKFIIYLPILPPSVNKAFAIIHGRKVLTKEQRDFRRIVASLVRRRIPSDWNYVQVEIILTPKKKMRFDVDNRVKPTLDALTECGFWKDDSQVALVKCYATEPRGNGSAIIIVRRATEKYLPCELLKINEENSIIIGFKNEWTNERTNERTTEK